MNTRTMYIAAGILIAVAAGWHFFSGNGSVVNYPPREGPIVAFGDSLVYGMGAPQEKSFVARLSARIGKPIENMGILGDTTTSGLARVDTVIEKHPSIVLLLLGGNDYLRKEPREQTFRNLSEIIMRLQADGAVVVLLGIRGGLLRDNFADGFDDLADEFGTTYVPDVLDGIIGVQKLMDDEIHPNSDGYALIAEKIYPVLSGVLR